MRNRGYHHMSQTSPGDTEEGFKSRSENSKASTAKLVFQRNVLMVFCFVLAAALVISLQGSSACGSVAGRPDENNCSVSLGTYHGPVYNSPESGTTGNPLCLVESKWLKVAQHTVKFPGSSNLITDWLWIDYHDRINVVVEDESKPGSERRFLVFEQTKYALEGRQSLAIIGGIIEPGEEPEQAARREVNEEMGLLCQNFHFLGRYRTDVNRGMGWVNGFLATKCIKEHKNWDTQKASEEVGAADSERQDLRSLSLSEMKVAASQGRFLEVQWTATVAQALLHPELMD